MRGGGHAPTQVRRWAEGHAEGWMGLEGQGGGSEKEAETGRELEDGAACVYAMVTCAVSESAAQECGARGEGGCSE